LTHHQSQALTDDYRKGLITLEEKDQAYERLAANAKAYNAAARVVNVAARSSEGVLPPEQTGDLVHALVKGVEIAATDQKEVLREVKDYKNKCSCDDQTNWLYRHAQTIAFS
jgi:uncharacterized protein (DUF885 family)